MLFTPVDVAAAATTVAVAVTATSEAMVCIIFEHSPVHTYVKMEFSEIL